MNPRRREGIELTRCLERERDREREEERDRERGGIVRENE